MHIKKWNTFWLAQNFHSQKNYRKLGHFKLLSLLVRKHLSYSQEQQLWDFLQFTHKPEPKHTQYTNIPVNVQYTKIYTLVIFSANTRLTDQFKRDHTSSSARWEKYQSFRTREPAQNRVSVAFLCLTPDQNHVQQCLNSKRRMKAPHWLQTPGRICVNRPTAPWESSRKSRGELKGASVSKVIWENSLYHIYLTGVTYICSQTPRKKLYRKNMSR